jgi:hypothetical protein
LARKVEKGKDETLSQEEKAVSKAGEVNVMDMKLFRVIAFRKTSQERAWTQQTLNPDLLSCLLV